MADFTIENVCRAIYQFQNGQVSESEEFLKQFSKSSEAWNLCISLLTDPDVCDDHIILHLIRILKTKILYDFSTLLALQLSFPPARAGQPALPQLHSSHYAPWQI